MDTHRAPSAHSAVLDAVRQSGAERAHVAVADIDGILRGKCLHIDAFLAAAEGGFGFNVFGSDLNDQAIDQSPVAGRRLGFPNATVALDLDTYRNIPWNEDVPFFLGNFVRPDGSPHPLCPRQVLKRVLARAAKMGFTVKIGVEFEFFNFKETPESWAAKHGVHPTPLTQGTFGYSLLRANANQDYFNALMKDASRFRIPLDALHTETGPGVYEAAILFAEGLEAADRAVLFKDAAKQIGARFGIMPSFMAKWHPRYPGCSGHVHQSLFEGERNVFHDPNGRAGGMSKVFESYIAGQLAHMLEVGPLIWPTINSYKRLVANAWAPVRITWGTDNRTAALRVLAGSPRGTRVENRCPGADMNAYLGIAAIVASGLAGIEKGLVLDAPPVTGDDEGVESAPRTPRTLMETTGLFKKSELARDWFGDEFVDYYSSSREWEWSLWLDAVTDWERKRYFEII